MIEINSISIFNKRIAIKFLQIVLYYNTIVAILYPQCISLFYIFWLNKT